MTSADIRRRILQDRQRRRDRRIRAGLHRGEAIKRALQQRQIGLEIALGERPRHAVLVVVSAAHFRRTDIPEVYRNAAFSGGRLRDDTLQADRVLIQHLWTDRPIV
jgi:hypothetical protein